MSYESAVENIETPILCSLHIFIYVLQFWVYLSRGQCLCQYC